MTELLIWVERRTTTSFSGVEAVAAASFSIVKCNTPDECGGGGCVMSNLRNLGICCLGQVYAVCLSLEVASALEGLKITLQLGQRYAGSFFTRVWLSSVAHSRL
jgi:hypothetical protein